MPAQVAQLQLKFRGRTYPDAISGLDEVMDLFKKTWEGSARQGRQALQDYLEHVALVLYDRNSKSWPGGTTATSISRRTGRSADSILRSVTVTGTTWETLKGAIGGSSQLYIHEYGGTMTSSGGKMLTIPLPAALSQSGTSPPFARQWRNTFVATSRKGNLIIFQRRGREIVPLYVLKDQVKIPARLGMAKELTTQIPYFLGKAADMVVSEFSQQMG
jgi:hypothetical protein